MVDDAAPIPISSFAGGGVVGESSTPASTTGSGEGVPTTTGRGRGRPKKRGRGEKGAATDGADTPAERKRRTTRASRQPVAPSSIAFAATHAALEHLDAGSVAARLSSNDPVDVSWGLNGLLRASADHDANYSLGLGGERVVCALVKLFDEAIGWDDDKCGGVWEDDEDMDNNRDLADPRLAWDASSLTGKRRIWHDFCRERLASPLASSSDPNLRMDPELDGKILDMIVAIVRNMSYVAANMRFLAHSEDLLRILTGGLYLRAFVSLGGGGDGDRGGGGTTGGEDAPMSAHISNICVHAIHALINLATLVDSTGRRIFIDRMLLDPGLSNEVRLSVPYQGQLFTSTAADSTINNRNEGKEGSVRYGEATRMGFGGMSIAKRYDGKAESVPAVPDSVVWDAVGSHVRTTRAIFPALLSILDPNDISSAPGGGWHRPSVHSALELLTALMENPDNRCVFLSVPDAALHRLTHLLSVPRLGPDSIDYVDPVTRVVSRVVALKLTMGYDAAVDSDLRDRAAELLVRLTDLSTDVKIRLGRSPSTSGLGSRERSYRNARDDAAYVPSGKLSPSILRTDESSSSRRINVRLYNSLLPMFSASSGRGDAGSLAARLVSNLAAVPENRAGVLYAERRLISMSSMDPHVANVACNGIFNRAM